MKNSSSLTHVPPGTYLLASNSKVEYRTFKKKTMGIVIEEICDKSKKNLKCLKVLADNTLLIVWSESNTIVG